MFRQVDPGDIHAEQRGDFPHRQAAQDVQLEHLELRGVGRFFDVFECRFQDGLFPLAIPDRFQFGGAAAGEAVDCYFDETMEAPKSIRLHFVRDEILAR